MGGSSIAHGTDWETGFSLFWNPAELQGIRLTNYTVDAPGWNCDILLAF